MRERKNLDKIAQWLAWHMPKRLVMWAMIRAIAYSTQGPWSKESMAAVYAIDVVGRWRRQTYDFDADEQITKEI
jgi:hypothetical protein